MVTLTSSLKDRDLERLTTLIAAGQVIPVIGDELLRTQEAGAEQSAADAVFREVALELAIPEVHGTLSDLAHTYLSRDGRPNMDEFRDVVYDAVQRVGWQPTSILEQLASIDGFRLILTTGFDPLIAAACASRDGRPPRVAGFASNAREKDLSVDWRTSRTVYHLFGYADLVTKFAVTEEDLLESLLQLQAHAPMLPELTRVLQQSHLLLLGCTYPDWLTRLFLRIARQKPLGESRSEREYLAESRDPVDASLTRFLKRFSTKTELLPIGADDLVTVLASQWARRGHGTNERPIATRSSNVAERQAPVFISYASEDRHAAEQLARSLDAVGLVAWIDSRELEGGEEYKRRIRERIGEVELFVPVLSAQSATRAEGFYRLEWQWAIERHSAIAPDVPFIVPVSVGPLSYSHPGIPEGLRKLHWLPAGSDGDDMIHAAEAIKTAMRNVRRLRARGAA